MNYSNHSGPFRSLPAQLSATKSVPNLPFATSLLHRIGENVGETLTKNKKTNNKNLKSKQQQPNFILQRSVFPCNKPNSVKYRNALNRKKSASLDLKVVYIMLIRGKSLLELWITTFFFPTDREP